MAAGAAALLMLKHSWSTSDVFQNVNALQTLLNSSLIGQPLLWDLAGAESASGCQKGFTCWENTCLGVSVQGSSTLYSNFTCDGICPPLSTKEWLAYSKFWTVPDENNISFATQPTILKKSATPSANLPPEEIFPVPQGQACTIKDAILFQDAYWLCEV